MEVKIDDGPLHIVIVDPIDWRRQLLTDVLRSLAFYNIEQLKSGTELLSYLSNNPVDWLIMSPLLKDQVNALHILDLATKEQKLIHLNISLVITKDDEYIVPLAFELGLLSWHRVTYVARELEDEISSHLNILAKKNWNTVLVASHYLRTYLTEKCLFQSLLSLEQNLLKSFPGDADLLLHLAEAFYHLKDSSNYQAVLNQITLLYPKLHKNIQMFREKNHLLINEARHTSHQMPKVVNMLDIKTAVVIDPDTSIQHLITQLFKKAGITEVIGFSDGLKAWNELKERPEPGIILIEWKIPGLTGPILLQRIRNGSLLNVPVTIISSLIKDEDIGLLREMGVDAILQKPFTHQSFFNSIISVLQQNCRPSEQRPLEQKITRLLKIGKIGEAERLHALFMKDSRFSQVARTTIEAQFAFYYGQYHRAGNLALEALQHEPDSLLLLNLLGRSFLNLGYYPQAMKCLERAQEISPRNIERLCLMAQTEIEMEHVQNAVTNLDKAKQIDNDAEEIKSTECIVALSSAQESSAKKLMAQIDIIPNVLSLMNNRAVALIKSGRFEKGLALYQNTLKALPGQQSSFHDMVCYNIGLAYAKYGSLKDSLKYLEKVSNKVDTHLLKKAKSLSIRVTKAITSGIPLKINLNQQNSRVILDEEAITEGEILQRQELAIKYRAERGERGCYLIFKNVEPINPHCVDLLKNPPSFHTNLAVKVDQQSETKSNLSKIQ